MAKKNSKRSLAQTAVSQEVVDQVSPPTPLQNVKNAIKNLAASTLGTPSEAKTLEGAEGKRESTRRGLSLLFIIGYFSFLFAVLLISYQKNFDVTGYKDMMLAVSGVLSSPLSFIIGYYFKSENNH